MPKTSTVPDFIREIRQVGAGSLEYAEVEDIITMTERLSLWLADPTAPDELRAGDAELLEKLRDYVQVRLTREPAVLDAYPRVLH